MSNSADVMGGAPRTIAVANQKGGTGKSTITVNLAAAMGERGLLTLVVDADPQSDTTSMLGIDPAGVEHTLYDVLTGSCELPHAVSATSVARVSLAVGDERMSSVEITLAGQMMRERYLVEALKDHTAGYDLVLIDCPPNLGLLTVNALCAAPEVLCVVSMLDRNAYKGAVALRATIAELHRNGIPVALTAVLRNIVDSRRVTYQVLNDALARSGLPLLHSEVPMAADFQNAATAGVPLLAFMPDHVGARAIRGLAGELLEPAAQTQAA